MTIFNRLQAASQQSNLRRTRRSIAWLQMLINYPKKWFPSAKKTDR
jgi:hypothetical protein